MEQLWDFTTFQVMLLRNGKKKKTKTQKKHEEDSIGTAHT